MYTHLTSDIAYIFYTTILIDKHASSGYRTWPRSNQHNLFSANNQQMLTIYSMLCETFVAAMLMLMALLLSTFTIACCMNMTKHPPHPSRNQNGLISAEREFTVYRFSIRVYRAKVQRKMVCVAYFSIFYGIIAAAGARSENA